MKMNKEKQWKGDKVQGKGSKKQRTGGKQRNPLAARCGALRRSGMWMNTCYLLLAIVAALFASCENAIISD
jgi:hypothetical protein